MQSWNGLTNVEALLLDHNALTGNLPSTWGTLEDLQVLSIGMALVDQGWKALLICDLRASFKVLQQYQPAASSGHFDAPLVAADGWHCSRGYIR